MIPGRNEALDNITLYTRQDLQFISQTAIVRDKLRQTHRAIDLRPCNPDLARQTIQYTDNQWVCPVQILRKCPWNKKGLHRSATSVLRLPLHQIQMAGTIEVTHPTLEIIAFLLRKRPEASNAWYISRLAEDPELQNIECDWASHVDQRDSKSSVIGPFVSRGYV